ncbi:exported hypothetical protein [Curtobacterium sp. 8I-2]|nr:exported hypothetical protein [Curtobacterium sp. 8I-2]
MRGAPAGASLTARCCATSAHPAVTAAPGEQTSTVPCRQPHAGPEGRGVPAPRLQSAPCAVRDPVQLPREPHRARCVTRCEPDGSVLRHERAPDGHRCTR